ncbi:orotate phosphoribosyltransferase [Patescibacteria group bacterium]|nr:orotate phosphoribosyltransferase [Patescibacteria group bacterium]
MEQYKKDFIDLLVRAQALMFGEFTLKSGRVAPYFLNTGKFFKGEYVADLGKAYAQAYLASGLKADVIFGPAYKGIPLCVSCVQALYGEGENLAYCFDRKESKEYGDKGGLLVGAPLDENTRVLIIDDVMTAGTAVRETMEVLKANGNPKVVGVLISLDRMEKAKDDEMSAVQAVERDFGIKAFSIVDLDDVVEALSGTVIDDEMKGKIDKYRGEYGV